MAIGNDSGSDLQSDINVTPLVDVVLVLLIIFMVIIPMTLRGYDVDIPGEATIAASAVDELEQIVLDIDVADCPALELPQKPGLPADCAVRLNDESLLVADLSRRVGETFADRAPDERVLFLAAEERLNYEAVMRIIDSAKSGAVGVKIGLVAE